MEHHYLNENLFQKSDIFLSQLNEYFSDQWSWRTLIVDSRIVLSSPSQSIRLVDANLNIDYHSGDDHHHEDHHDDHYDDHDEKDDDNDDDESSTGEGGWRVRYYPISIL